MPTKLKVQRDVTFVSTQTSFEVGYWRTGLLSTRTCSSLSLKGLGLLFPAYDIRYTAYCFGIRIAGRLRLAEEETQQVKACC